MTPQPYPDPNVQSSFPFAPAVAPAVAVAIERWERPDPEGKSARAFRKLLEVQKWRAHDEERAAARAKGVWLRNLYGHLRRGQLWPMELPGLASHLRANGMQPSPIVLAMVGLVAMVRYVWDRPAVYSHEEMARAIEACGIPCSEGSARGWWLRLTHEFPGWIDAWETFAPNPVRGGLTQLRSAYVPGIQTATYVRELRRAKRLGGSSANPAALAEARARRQRLENYNAIVMEHAARERARQESARLPTLRQLLTEARAAARRRSGEEFSTRSSLREDEDQIRSRFTVSGSSTMGGPGRCAADGGEGPRATRARSWCKLRSYPSGVEVWGYAEEGYEGKGAAVDSTGGAKPSSTAPRCADSHRSDSSALPTPEALDAADRAILDELRAWVAR